MLVNGREQQAVAGRAQAGGTNDALRYARSLRRNKKGPDGEGRGGACACPVGARAHGTAHSTRG